MDDVGVKPADIKSIDDISKLPFTCKQDLRDNYPFGLFAVPMQEIVRVHASSGTTGKPTTVGYTRNDLNVWKEAVARCFTMCGIGTDDVMQIAYGYGLFTGGLVCIMVLKKWERQLFQFRWKYAPSASTDERLRHYCTCKYTSYALHLADVIAEHGYSLEDFKLKKESLGLSHGQKICGRELRKMGNTSVRYLWLSEVMGPGVSNDCEYHNGLHVNEDPLFPEIVHPITTRAVSEGEEGELVFTTLTKEGIPLIGYNTRDLSSLCFDKCECGRTLVLDEKSLDVAMTC